MSEQPPSAESLAESKRAIEAMILVASDPTSVYLLAQVIELSPIAAEDLCRELAAEYEAQNRGFQLVEVAGGWIYQTHPDLHAYVERYAMEGIPNRLSSAALETLAIVAYKQPISRSQISSIRGVNVDGVLRTLEQRGYVEETGRDDGPGQASLFGTTDYFLERLGLPSTAELPPLGEFVPSAEVVEALEQTLRFDPDEVAGSEEPGESIDQDDVAEEEGPVGGVASSDDDLAPDDASADALDASEGSESEPLVDDGVLLGPVGARGPSGLVGDASPDALDASDDARSNSGPEDSIAPGSDSELVEAREEPTPVLDSSDDVAPEEVEPALAEADAHDGGRFQHDGACEAPGRFDSSVFAEEGPQPDSETVKPSPLDDGPDTTAEAER